MSLKLRRIAICCLLSCVSVVAYAQGRPRPFPLPEEPQVYQTGDETIRVSVVARGLSHPFSLLVLPNGDMLVTERNVPQLRAIRQGVLDPVPVPGLPDIRTGFHSGLLEVVAHPQFATNRLIYFTYHRALEAEGEYTIVLARAHYDGVGLSDVETLYSGTPTTLSGGSRIAFGPDGLVYFTTGGATRGNVGDNAQNLMSSFGKVLRLHEDGSIPSTNPFVGRDDALPEIYSYGHRDQYGLTFHPVTGDLLHAELGPLGGDKINVIKAGGNYGWPLYGHGRQNDSSPMEHPFREGIEQSLITWQPGIVPNGLVVYTGDAFPGWRGNLFTGSIHRGRIPGTGGLERVAFSDKMWELTRETLVTELHQRVRDVRQGPDGFLYILTDEDDGAVIRIEPAQ